MQYPHTQIVHYYALFVCVGIVVIGFCVITRRTRYIPTIVGISAIVGMVVAFRIGMLLLQLIGRY